MEKEARNYIQDLLQIKKSNRYINEKKYLTELCAQLYLVGYYKEYESIEDIDFFIDFEEMAKYNKDGS